MTPTQYRAALKKLGLSQHGAAALFGYSPRAGQGWALGEYPIPPLVAANIRMMLKGKFTAEELAAAM